MWLIFTTASLFELNYLKEVNFAFPDNYRGLMGLHFYPSARKKLCKRPGVKALVLLLYI
jgi:hypothetical protein